MQETIDSVVYAAHLAMRNIAVGYANGDPDQADDLYQTMAENLILRTKSDSQFPRQKAAYIRRAAQLAALGELRRQVTYRHYNAPRAALPSEDGIYVDLIVFPAPSPEESLIAAEDAFRVLDALRRMKPRDRKIVSLLYQGYRTSEIAVKLGMSRAQVSQRRRLIAATARAVL